MKKYLLVIFVSLFTNVLVISAAGTEVKTNFDSQKSAFDTFGSTLVDKENTLLTENILSECSINGTIFCLTTPSYGVLVPISKAEYEIIGAYESYLLNESPFWTITGDPENSSHAFAINSNGVMSVNKTEEVGVRPSVFVNNNKKVSGNGTKLNPFRFTN